MPGWGLPAQKERTRPGPESLAAALALGLNSAEIHLNLSSVALGKKKYDEAIAEVRLALGISAELAEVSAILAPYTLKKA